ncbi:hypothetical protein Rwratislav_26524 [Rhodococcus wratislaviensis IFP 2016]|nr:hypothetical protein Rwratislav_26524 [Rhodococcus wratislaviensis IFP 2016]CAG7619018.1 hypothetical protein E143388_06127 [Rhodococcus opacus]
MVLKVVYPQTATDTHDQPDLPRNAVNTSPVYEKRFAEPATGTAAIRTAKHTPEPSCGCDRIRIDRRHGRRVATICPGRAAVKRRNEAVQQPVSGVSAEILCA